MDGLLLGIVLYVVMGAAAYAAVSAPTAEDVPMWKLLTGLAVAGAILGLGKLLASSEKLTLRLILGRAIVSGGLAVGAGAVLTFIPNLPVLALCGIAAVSAVLGEQFLERVLNSKFNVR